MRWPEDGNWTASGLVREWAVYAPLGMLSASFAVLPLPWLTFRSLRLYARRRRRRLGLCLRYGGVRR